MQSTRALPMPTRGATDTRASVVPPAAPSPLALVRAVPTGARAVLESGLFKHVCEWLATLHDTRDAEAAATGVGLVRAAAMVGVMQGTVDAALGGAMEEVINALLHVMT